MLAAVAVYLAADLSVLTMSLDGVIYASLAKLSAASTEAGFWYPLHVDANLQTFHDHPPLGIWLQTQWFALLGDHFWTERLWCLAQILLIAALITSLWKTVSDHATAAWWPLVIFFLMPVSTTALKGNTLDTTVTITALAAVAIAWRGRTRAMTNVWVGACCAVGFLIKGPVALFPLAAPAIFAWVLDRNLYQVIRHSLLALVSVVALTGGFVMLTSGEEALQAYLQSQLLASLTGQRGIEHGRAYQLGQLAIQLAVAGLLLGLAWLSTRRAMLSRQSIAFLLIGFCASLPLLLSPRQYRHYLLPCLPFFAIGFALVCQPAMLRVRTVYVTAAASLLIVVAVWRSIMVFGQPGKDADQIADVATIAAYAAAEGLGTVAFCSSHATYQAYLARHHAIRSTVEINPQSFWICHRRPSRPGGIALSDGLYIWQTPALPEAD